MAEKTAILASKETELTQAIQSSTVTQQNNQTHIAELETLRKVKQTLIDDRNQKLEEAVALADKLHQAQAEIAILRERNSELTDDFSRATAVLRHHGLKISTPLDNKPPVGVSGVVTLVDAKKGIGCDFAG